MNSMDKDIRRIRLLKLWEILSSETDKEHPLSTEEIIDRLAEIGIDCHRITLYEDIKLLNKYGYEVLCVRSSSNKYYVADRNISVPEVLILMDAVQAASFVTEIKTGELIDKVAKLAGSQKAEVLKQNIVEFTIAKTTNDSVYASVSEISQAIIHNKKIKFNYFDYDIHFNRAYRMKKSEPDKKRTYKVNPLGTVFDNGYYYLFCYDDYYKNIAHYRIDRMSDVAMQEEDITEGIDVRDFDLPTRKRQLFDMFGGTEESVTIHADNSLIDVLYDKFGEDITLYTASEHTVGFTANVQVSPTFIAWCCSFGNKLAVKSPSTVVEKVKEYIKQLNENY